MKVLVAEDNEGSRNLLVKQLRALGHEVTAVSNGVDALQQALKEAPDILVTDILMPQMDGYQLCHEWKRNERLVDVPFIFYTATYTLEEDEKFALSLGASAFIRKPTEPDVFIKKLLEIFEKAKSGLLRPPEIAPPELSLYLSEYNKRIVTKLEKKMLDLEAEITRRKRGEEKLRQSEEQYRLIAENARDVIITTDMNLRLTYVSPSIRYLGTRIAKEVMATSLEKLLTPASLKVATKAFVEELEIANRQPRDPAESRTLELEIIRQDGSTIWTEAKINFLREAEGRPAIGIIAVLRDITERKRIEEELRLRAELLDNATDSIFVHNIEGNFIYVNERAYKSRGYTKDELMGMNLRELDTPEYARFIEPRIANLTEKGEFTFESAHFCKDKSIIPLEIHSRIIDSGGQKLILSVARDITERKRAEEERRQLEQKAQIASRLASVGEMAAGVAHEINNPLTAVTGYAQLLMDRENIPPDIRSDLEAINDGARRVAGIVRTLLAFSRQTKSQRKLVDINELIESTLILRVYHLRVNNIEVVTRLAPDVPETVADPGQIQQVLLNLIVNAEMEMKLAHGKGKLTITTEKSDNTIKICVKDNGPGIKPDVMDKIFDPFFTTREVGEGTGLGLSLCYGIVAEHKGKIYAESKPGKGATFVVELPIVTEVKPPKPAEPLVKTSQKAGKARILVVDDEQMIRDFVKRVLAGEGCKVDTADNARDALKMIESKRYHLILLDIKMPGISGIELYKRLQKIAPSLAKRVMFITGDVMGADTEEFLSKTKVARIHKPFNVEQLTREVKRALSGGR